MSLFTDDMDSMYRGLQQRLQGVPIEDIAEAAWLHPSTVFAIREGKRKTFPHMETLRSLDAALTEWEGTN